MALALIIETDQLALKVDKDGTVRVGGTRVTLDTVVSVFESGASAEEIANRYPSLHLADVYSVIGYYLKHKEEIGAYLLQREKEAEQIRQEVESRWPSAGVRERLLNRLAERTHTSQER